MVKRPIFAPTRAGRNLVDSRDLEFRWSPGFALVQKQKNIRELHAAAAEIGIQPVLEISSKSPDRLGIGLSAFNLTFGWHNKRMSVECAFQGSKRFTEGGPFVDLYEARSIDAKRDGRLKSSGRLTGFRFFDIEWPLNPPTAFYDWLYLTALAQQQEAVLDKLSTFAGFSDIEFNPKKSINCQARSAAVFCSLANRGIKILHLKRDEYLAIVHSHHQQLLWPED